MTESHHLVSLAFRCCGGPYAQMTHRSRMVDELLTIRKRACSLFLLRFSLKVRLARLSLGCKVRL